MQGVWFRASTQKEALRLGLSGFVRNEPDGSVYLEATGTQEQLASMVDWCRHGPELAVVAGVETTAIDTIHSKGFGIQRAPR